MMTLMCCLALFAMAIFTSTAFAQDIALTSVHMKFDTTTDNKNPDSKLDVYISGVRNRQVRRQFRRLEQ